MSQDQQRETQQTRIPLGKISLSPVGSAGAAKLFQPASIVNTQANIKNSTTLSLASVIYISLLYRKFIIKRRTGSLQGSLSMRLWYNFQLPSATLKAASLYPLEQTKLSSDHDNHNHINTPIHNFISILIIYNILYLSSKIPKTLPIAFSDRERIAYYTKDSSQAFIALRPSSLMGKVSVAMISLFS